MTHKSNDTGADMDLEAFFAAEKATDLRPSDDLMSAVLRGALAAQPTPLGVAGAKTGTVSGGSWFGDIMRVFGGWQGGLTLASCLVIGLSLGYTPPDALRDLAGDVLETAGISIEDVGYSPLDDMWVEG